MLTGLVPASQTQADLFDDRDRGRSKRLMSALDAINDRWGAGTLHYASSGITQSLEDAVSPPFTCLHDRLG